MSPQGKFIRINFDVNGYIVGANIETCILVSDGIRADGAGGGGALGTGCCSVLALSLLELIALPLVWHWDSIKSGPEMRHGAQDGFVLDWGELLKNHSWGPRAVVAAVLCPLAPSRGLCGVSSLMSLISRVL